MPYIFACVMWFTAVSVTWSAAHVTRQVCQSIPQEDVILVRNIKMTEKKWESSAKATQQAKPDANTEGLRYYTPYSNSTRQWPPQDKTVSSASQSETLPTWNGEKSVWQAAVQGDIPALQSFLANGVNVDQMEDEGYTPLIYAAQEGQNNVVEFLLNNGANVNATNLYGWTPLMAAVAGGHVDTVKLLLERGVEVKAKAGVLTNPPEDTAIAIATRKGYFDIVGLLKEAGA